MMVNNIIINVKSKFSPRTIVDTARNLSDTGSPVIDVFVDKDSSTYYAIEDTPQLTAAQYLGLSPILRIIDTPLETAHTTLQTTQETKLHFLEAYLLS